MEADELLLAIFSPINVAIHDNEGCITSLHHCIAKVNSTSPEGHGHILCYVLIFLALQVGFYTQVLEFSMADHVATPIEQVACMEEAGTIAKEGWALVELEQSMVVEACQVLM